MRMPSYPPNSWNERRQTCRQCGRVRGSATERQTAKSPVVTGFRAIPRRVATACCFWAWMTETQQSTLLHLERVLPAPGRRALGERNGQVIQDFLALHALHFDHLVPA